MLNPGFVTRKALAQWQDSRRKAVMLHKTKVCYERGTDVRHKDFLVNSNAN